MRKSKKPRHWIAIKISRHLKYPDKKDVAASTALRALIGLVKAH